MQKNINHTQSTFNDKTSHRKKKLTLFASLMVVCCAYRDKLTYSSNFSNILALIIENNYQLFMVERLIMQGTQCPSQCCPTFYMFVFFASIFGFLLIIEQIYMLQPTHSHLMTNLQLLTSWLE
jgi:hypothetical protein